MVGFSAVSGQGTDSLLKAIEEARQEYFAFVQNTVYFIPYNSVQTIFCFSEYKPEYEKLRERKLKEASKKEKKKASDLPDDAGTLKINVVRSDFNFWLIDLSI